MTKLVDARTAISDSGPRNQDSRLVSVCREHLAEKNCTLWGQAFNVQDERGLERAAQWLAQQVMEVILLRQERTEEPLPEYREDDRPEVEDGYDQAPELFEHGPLAGVR